MRIYLMNNTRYMHFDYPHTHMHPFLNPIFLRSFSLVTQLKSYDYVFPYIKSGSLKLRQIEFNNHEYTLLARVKTELCLGRK